MRVMWGWFCSVSHWWSDRIKIRLCAARAGCILQNSRISAKEYIYYIHQHLPQFSAFFSVLFYRIQRLPSYYDHLPGGLVCTPNHENKAQLIMRNIDMASRNTPPSSVASVFYPDSVSAADNLKNATLFTRIHIRADPQVVKDMINSTPKIPKHVSS